MVRNTLIGLIVGALQNVFSDVEERQRRCLLPGSTFSTNPKLRPEDTIAKARSRTLDAGWDECVVIDCDGIVIGRLRSQAWEAGDDATAEKVMESSPTTVRPDGLLQSLIDRMAKRETKLVLVTTPPGWPHRSSLTRGGRAVTRRRASRTDLA